MNKCKDPKMSVRIGGVLREMMYQFKYGERDLVISYNEAEKDSGIWIDEAAPIAREVFDSLRPKIKSVYPLKRDPKTGRMMKAGKE